MTASFANICPIITIEITENRLALLEFSIASLIIVEEVQCGSVKNAKRKLTMNMMSAGIALRLPGQDLEDRGNL